MPSPRLQTLEAVESAAWAELARAVATREHPWRVAVLATVGAPAGTDDPAAATSAVAAAATEAAEAGAAAPAPAGVDARSIILREVDHTSRRVVFFSDARSAKVWQIGRQPAGMLVLWSPALGWQLRLQVALEVATSGLAVSSRWARLKMTPAAQDYLSPLPPGSALAHPAPAPERSTREHFCVVTAQVRRLDWLELHEQGHRRAIFDAAGPRWVVP
jgi:hypothetical protein